jgi:hypothetical protein
VSKSFCFKKSDFYPLVLKENHLFPKKAGEKILPTVREIAEKMQSIWDIEYSL